MKDNPARLPKPVTLGYQNIRRMSLLVSVIFLLLLPTAIAQTPSSKLSPRTIVLKKSPESPTPLPVIVAQHRRVLIDDPVQRVAVGDTSIVSAQLINNKEILFLGQRPGRTSVIVWLQSGAIRHYQCNVQLDLSVLHAALHNVHPSIGVTSAPDRDALILTGKVPDVTYSQAAEGIAQKYVNARTGERKAGQGPFVKSSDGQRANQSQPGRSSQSSGSSSSSSDDEADGESPSSDSSAHIEVAEAIPVGGTIINLIQLDTLPATPEERMQEAIRNLGGEQVTVRRVKRGIVRDDEQDVFVLEGSVKNQVALLRVLEVGSRMLTGHGATRHSIRVVGDEAGALAGRLGQQQGGQQGQQGRMMIGGGGGGIGQLFGGAGRSGRVSNLVQSNLGRAKVIEAANGRIISFLHVRDLPQIRVNIKLYEVNRTKLRSYGSDFVGTFDNFGSAPESGARNILGFLTGTLVADTFIRSGEFAIRSVFTYLESLDLARSLASPSLTVLSGEIAAFLVGGEVPIEQAFSPFFGGGDITGAAGVFQFVTFREFGISLRVRALVGEDGDLTIDAVPQVVTPDLTLTAGIEEATGTNQPTTAFKNRSMQTSARMQDGQAILIGGLLSRDKSDQQDFIPGVRDIPGLGWLFRRFTQNDEEVELVIVIHPVIMREPIPEVGLWAFPTLTDYRPAWEFKSWPAPEEKGL
ncbi:pilus assembly protein N-terminal domain-containing protein [Nitrospira sp. MA-1]|nr:pilus assembly protein N-terminal domain-containing protein [Nitrospira sp. MA-1]